MVLHSWMGLWRSSAGELIDTRCCYLKYRWGDILYFLVSFYFILSTYKKKQKNEVFVNRDFILGFDYEWLRKIMKFAPADVMVSFTVFPNSIIEITWTEDGVFSSTILNYDDADLGDTDDEDDCSL
jgi:hypothetical protein